VWWRCQAWSGWQAVLVAPSEIRCGTRFDRCIGDDPLLTGCARAGAAVRWDQAPQSRPSRRGAHRRLAGVAAITRLEMSTAELPVAAPSMGPRKDREGGPDA